MLELTNAGPAELNTKCNEPHRKHDAEGSLRRDGSYISAGKCAENPADHQFGENCQIVIARAQLESAADQRGAQAKEKSRAAPPCRGERREPQQRQRSNSACASRRKSNFSANWQRDSRQPARPIPLHLARRLEP